MINSEDIKWIDDVVERIKDKMEWVSAKSRYKIPYTTLNGVHDNRADGSDYAIDNGINWWCNGFWGGMLWLLYNETKDERYADIARFSEEKMDQCFLDYEGLHHDVGFMWIPTAVTNYKLTGSSESKKRALHAANILAGRFNPVGKFIRAWNDIPNEPEKDTRGWAIIDSVFNIPLLYWATEETKDPRFKQIAIMHADTVMNNFVRGDGSVRHIVEFDFENGGYVRDFGGQGYGVGSSWTRGQTWGIYGFMMSYIHTGKKEYLDTAKRIAHYFIANIPESGLIPVDFRQPKEPAIEDSTAAAIAACGLIEIAKYVGDLEKDMYLNAALKLLKTLDKNRCNWTKENDCILEKCTAAYHDKTHEFNIIYGDYYFIEAIFKLKGNDIFIWY